MATRTHPLPPDSLSSRHCIVQQPLSAFQGARDPLHELASLHSSATLVCAPRSMRTRGSWRRLEAHLLQADHIVLLHGDLRSVSALAAQWKQSYDDRHSSACMCYHNGRFQDCNSDRA
ncbi:unnamed protein product, partial [Musa acuminata subsp. burmannicoides]